jgi:hypothetical protein
MTTTHCPECPAATAVPTHAREGRCLGARPPVEAERLADSAI